MTESPAETVREVLERIAERLGISAEVDVTEDDEGIVGRYSGADLEPLVGERGQTIDAIQHLTYRIAFRGNPNRRRVAVDAGDYRARQAEALRATADQAVRAAVEGHRPVVMEAMSAAERRIVHEHLKSSHDVETYSQGEEPDRRLVVAPLVD